MDPKNRQKKQTVDGLFAAGYQCHEKGQFSKAIEAYRKALSLDPKNDAVHNNLGNCYRSIGAFENALNHFDQALALKPEKRTSQLNKSLALLALDRYEEAWPLYRHRLSTIEYRKEILTCGKPEWDGKRLGPDETLYIYGNQGLGDEIQMLRYLPSVAKRVSNLVLEVQEPIYELVKNIPGISQIHIRGSETKALPEFDFQCEFFTLPGIFRTRFEAVPPPYRPSFTPDCHVRSIISDERKKFPDYQHIGLVWSGSPKNDLNPYRACGLVHYLPLLDLPRCRFYSLQKGSPRNDIDRFQNQIAGRLVDLSGHLPHLASTATAIDELDLLITTDTSVPHLAGTLGATSWLLLNTPSDWRWTIHQNTTPWYPQLRLFRQNPPRQWITMMEEVAGELQRFGGN